MKPRNFWNVENVSDEKGRWTQLTLFLKDVYAILTGGLTFKDNLRGVEIEFDFTTANQEFTIKHGLSFTPTRFFIVKKPSSIDVYSEREFDDRNIYLHATAVGKVTIQVY